MRTFFINDLKQQNEDIETKYLSRYACTSKNSRGRLKEEKECELRTVFQRDRDKILHSKIILAIILIYFRFIIYSS